MDQVVGRLVAEYRAACAQIEGLACESRAAVGDARSEIEAVREEALQALGAASEEMARLANEAREAREREVREGEMREKVVRKIGYSKGGIESLDFRRYLGYGLRMN